MLTNKIAKVAIEDAQKEAEGLGIKISIAVVDEHGIIVNLAKMDGAFVVSPEFAYQKAYTSATLGLPTADIAKYSIPGSPYYNIVNILPGKLTTIEGGLPVIIDGNVVGGVGVGGSSDVTQDTLCAKKAVEILKAHIK